MYFKFNDRSEIVIDTNSILYALIIDTPEIKKGLEEIKMAMENLWKYTELSKEERIKKN